MPSFGVRIVRILGLLLELCLREKMMMMMKKKKKKERKKEKRRRKKENKMKFFAFDFVNCEEKYGNSGPIFYIRIAKGFHL